MGTAKDSRGTFFQRHREADLGDGLTYREAFTTTAAEAAVAHLVNNRRLAIDRDAAPEPGKIVFVYRGRKSPESEVRGPKSEKQWLVDSGEFQGAGDRLPAAATPGSDRPTFRKLAA